MGSGTTGGTVGGVELEPGATVVRRSLVRKLGQADLLRLLRGHRQGDRTPLPPALCAMGHPDPDVGHVDLATPFRFGGLVASR